MKPLWLIILLTVCAGCDTLQFYSQAVSGQVTLLKSRVPVAQMLADPDTSAMTQQRLAVAQSILSYAAESMDIAADGRYSSYVDLSREYVLWNVFAAPPYDLTGKQWCYPIVGCAPYRGYFKLDRAQAVAARYREQGMETFVGGVPAYSTLGYFDDPLLSSFIAWPDADLANLLIHELAHGKVWVSGDVAFNESFAEFVGQRGAAGWLASRGQQALWQTWQQERRGWLSFRDFVVAAKVHLQEIYAQPTPEVRKSNALRALQACYKANRTRLGNGRYDNIMRESFNNAFLISVSTYADHIPAFTHLFAQAGEDWPAFFNAVEELAGLSEQKRALALEELQAEYRSMHQAENLSKGISCDPMLTQAVARQNH